ncbi:MAG TPA: DUF1993 domain-containing protein [Novosphingobium sp.]
MSILHTASVGTFLQILPAVSGLATKAEDLCGTQELPEATLLDARLAEDMWPLAKQIALCATHSAGAIEAIGVGLFSPDLTPPPTSFAALRALLAEAQTKLEATDPEQLAVIAERDMRFEFGTRRMDFTVRDFLLSFALPNFYFHATTAYAILRNQGLPLGKVDFIGRPRLKG